MKNVGKKIFACCGAFLMVTAMSITVFATTLTGSSLGHKNDKWEYGIHYSLLRFDKEEQYSYFYCKDKKHTATAIQKSSSKKYMSKKTADKGKTAKAETGYHKNFTEWNSYYNHD